MEYWWKFLSDILKVLEIFSIFPISLLIQQYKAESFYESYVGNDDEKRNELNNKWDSFKFELILVGRKCFQLNENLSWNKLKPDLTGSWKRFFGTIALMRIQLLFLLQKLYISDLSVMYDLNGVHQTVMPLIRN